MMTMDDDDDVKEGLKRSMSEPAKKISSEELEEHRRQKALEDHRG